MRLLALVPDAFGGRGGIAKFNRDLLSALLAHPSELDVVAMPRVIVEPVGKIPHRLTFLNEAAGTKARYVSHLGRLLSLDRHFDGVICGHINLLPLAVLAARRCQCAMLLIVHGIEVWTAPRNRLKAAMTRHLVRHASALVTVSAHTHRRMASWLDTDGVPAFVVPNCIDVSAFGPGPGRQDLIERYGLQDRTVLMTLARLSAAERYKGVDEVIDLLPTLAEDVPNVAYLVCGDGDDRARLEQKARALGLQDRVVFAGYIPDDEKADHYRLADAFVMPGRGEGFGIVYLEALACGVPVVASEVDASREAVLNGELGAIVNPDDATDIRRGILAALECRHEVPHRLDHFSTDRFAERWHAVVEATFAKTTTAGSSKPKRALIQAP